jgi:glycosyltransferase involved in cell wall biosynthesis
MRAVLMLCYFFPPLGGGGVQRSAKFAKYLPEHGWKPVVITVRPNRRNRIDQGVDPSLVEGLREDAEVIRCPSLEFAGLYELLHHLRLRKALLEIERLVPFLHQDYKIGWYPFALRAARRRLESSPTDVIYTSSPPYAAHLIGRTLRREYGIPWVADFRDPWTLLTTYRPWTPLHAKLDRRFEAAVLNSADAVIANTPTNRTNVVRAFGISPGKIHVIPNGYDPEEFEHADRVASPSRFVISCVGKFYEWTDPEVFLRAYRRFHHDHPDSHLRFLGPRSRAVRQATARLLEPGSWEASERIKHTEAVAVMCSSAALLANLPFMTDAHCVPGKVYEYLAARRPILLIGPVVGEAATILHRTRAGTTVSNEEDSIVDVLRGFYRDWKAGRQLNSDLDVVHEYDRSRQTRILAALFESMRWARNVASVVP